VISEAACSTCGGSVPRLDGAACLPGVRGQRRDQRKSGDVLLQPPLYCLWRHGYADRGPLPDLRRPRTERRARQVKVRIPPGVEDGQRIRVPGRGGAGRYGGPAGDLYVVVHIAPHPVFGQKGKDLTVKVPITFAEAALGTTVAVPTLNSKPVNVKVLPGPGRGASSGSQAWVPKAGKPGDLLVTFEVDVPAKLSADERRALEALARASEGSGHKLREKTGS